MMNSNFTDEQIKAYASQFREGDAIWSGGKWCEVVIFDDDLTIKDGDSKNGYIINFGKYHNFEGVTDGFREALATDHFRVTTLEHYELQGGEKIVWLGGSGGILTLGKVHDVNSCGRYIDIIGNPRLAKSSRWGVIPRYEHVEHLNNFNEPEKDVSSFKEDLTAVINELQDTLESKNKDYGDSFQRSYNEFGMTVVNIRLTDKFNRFKQLVGGNEASVDESLRDTIKDIAGYMVLTLIAMDKDDEKES